MRILHVTLGNPIYKQGGLNRYCKELIDCQIADGHSSFLIYPGTFLNSKFPIVCKRKDNVFKIIDALPVSITYGISDPNRYMVETNFNRYSNWLRKVKPQIIHVHSFQGIHKEFFLAAKKIGIPIMYTTHDYFPLCLKSILYDNHGCLCENRTLVACAECNQQTGLSKKTQRIIQSDLYQLLKNVKLIKRIRSKQRTNTKIVLNTTSKEPQSNNHNQEESYRRLLDYYSDMLSYVDLFHCNSSLTYKKYSDIYPDLNYEVLPITRAGLHQERHHRKNSDVLNVGYMGGMSEHKGFHILMDVFSRLEDQKDKWNLWLYGGEFAIKKSGDEYKYVGFFTQDEEDNVWANTDLLVVPSRWPETFGFIVLEALCRGVPVLCSDLVGSQDLLKEIDASLVFHYDDAVELEKKIRMFFEKEYYNQIINKISKAHLESTMEMHARSISTLYRRLIKG